MERIDLRDVPHAERQRWRSGAEWDDAAPKVAVGELVGGWYVRMYGAGRDEARAWTGAHAEWYALGAARRWMRTLGGEWVEA